MKPAWWIAGLTLICAAFAAFGLSVGAMHIPLTDFRSLPWEADSIEEAVLWNIRAPRVLMALLVGGALGMAGAALQGMFRNPLADPGLLGISSGAAIGAVAAIVLVGGSLAARLPFLLPLAAFAGAMAASLAVYLIGRRGMQVGSLLLAGIAINALSGAGLGWLTYLAREDQLRELTFWSMGSLGRANWTAVFWVALVTVPAWILLPRMAPGLNAFLLGESEAFSVGFSVPRIKAAVVVLTSLAVGVGVAFTGVIGFLGLVVPHAVRMTIGPDHRWLMPGSALLGAGLLAGSDIVARLAATPAEIPIGVVTATFGAPVFLLLLLRQTRA